MEVFGGFMMMLSIIGFFLTVIWFVLPFVIFSIKGRVDRTLEVVEKMEKRLADLERTISAQERVVRQQPVDEAGTPLPEKEQEAEV
ncbi:hypothetical protein L4X63_22870 [Geomonas sp. Red32]|uniref:hypothetical protein n=1 Tax=Geomonas sp. Red32 TaxID=2912856 RepID=UPI00202CFFDE|nr:hypothetical protein [Geomonas sp. Red32]MCM0084425.1 hypothetical protein [Geomonas sp. Red32]